MPMHNDWTAPDRATGPRNPWPHAPVHELTERGAYLVTAGTYQKTHLFKDGPRLRMLHQALLSIVTEQEWTLDAWAVFPNHYHFVAWSGQRPESLRGVIRELHSRTARALNRHDQAVGRKVWHNFWETHLSFQPSYLARLNYVHQNAVRHGLVTAANAYPFCSAAWFEQYATPAQVGTIYSLKIDRVEVYDDF